MREIVVYFDRDYTVNKSIYITYDLDRDEITKRVIEELGDEWYSYDICS